MSICLIVNAAAGRRHWRSQLNRALGLTEAAVDVRFTEYCGHAAELAFQAAERGCSVIAAAGGDGTAHEVAHGILRSRRHDVTLAVLPFGSANDYAHSVAQQFGTSRLDDEAGACVDIGEVRCNGYPKQYFIESIGIGLSALVTLDSRRITRLRGTLLYGLAAWRALKQGARATALSIAWDGAPAVDQTTLTMSLMLGRREGHFVLAPNARLDDGKFDYVHAASIGRWSALAMLPRLAISGPPTNHPQITLGQCETVRIESHEPFAIHTDGEIFATLDDTLRSIEIRMIPRRLRVKVCNTGK